MRAWSAGVVALLLLRRHGVVLRVLMVMGGLAAAAVSLAVGAGQGVLRVRAGSVAGSRAVSWPTRKETMQTTAIVFGFVVVMALFLFSVDTTLAWIAAEAVMGRGER